MRKLLFALALILLVSCGQQETVPEDISRLNDLGVSHAQQGNYEAAKEQFHRVLEIDLSHETARKNLALIYFEEKNYSVAENHFRMLTQLRPNEPSYHYNLGISIAEQCLLNGECRLMDAIAEFERAEELSPGFERAAENAEALRNVLAGNSSEE